MKVQYNYQINQRRQKMNTKYQTIKEIDNYIGWIKVDKSENTIYDYSRKIERFFDFLNIETFEDVKSITIQNCRDYVIHLSKDGLKMSSINSNIRPLKALFSWLVESDHISKSPFSKINPVKEPQREVDYLTTEEARATIKACSRLEDKAIISVLLTTGLRRSEITNLKLSNYNGTHLTFVGKGNKERSLPLLNDVKTLLNEYINLRNKKYGSS